MYYALIMAGGVGTRLWPLSREKTPKQALTLIGNRSMFQHAVDRLSPLFTPEKIFVVTSSEYVETLANQEPEIPVENFIIEPEGRGTAPAIGLAALHLQRKDTEAVMAVLTADHFISHTEDFRHALKVAYKMAMDNYLVTLGIQPNEPATGYGYIHQAGLIKVVDKFSIYQVARFVEKPCLEDAQKMLTSGDYSWNSGMFIWKISTILAEFARQMPGFYDQLIQISSTLANPECLERIKPIWSNVKKETIDYGIMEGAKQVVVIPVNIGWADIGSWGSLYDLLSKDDQGNISVGDTIHLHTSNTLSFGGKRLIAAIGVEDLIIVDTEDALLVCKRGHEQDVKTIVSRLKDEDKHHLI